MTDKKLPINGADALGVFILVLYAAASALWWVTRAAATQFVAIPLLLLFLFRFFSRSPWRRRENNVFLAPARALQLAWVRRRDPAHHYFRCPACGRILRIASRAGQRDVRCPRCAALFTYRLRTGEGENDPR